MPSQHLVRIQGSGLQGVAPWKIHGLVCRWLEWPLREVHHRPKPFSIGPVSGRLGEDLGFTLGLLDDSLVWRLERGIASAPEMVGFGRVTLASREVTTAISWDDIMYAELERPPRSYTFRLGSPTYFRQGRYIVRPVPTPGLVFGHLRDRWELYAPGHMRPTIDFRELGLELVDVSLRRSLAVLKDRSVIGSIGDLTVNAERASDGDVSWLERLARITDFIGIGSSTAHGCGAATYLRPRSASDGESRESPAQTAG